MVEILDYTEPATADNFYTFEDIFGSLFNSNPMTSPNRSLIRPTINDERGQGLDRSIRQLPSRFREITEQAERASPQRIGKKVRKSFRKAMDRAEKWHQGIASLPQVPAFAYVASDPRVNNPVPLLQALPARQWQPDRAVGGNFNIVQNAVPVGPNYRQVEEEGMDRYNRANELVRVGSDLPVSEMSPYDVLSSIGGVTTDAATARAAADTAKHGTLRERMDKLLSPAVSAGADVVAPLVGDLRPAPAGLVTTGPGSYYERGATELGEEPAPKSWLDLGKQGLDLLDYYRDAGNEALQNIIGISPDETVATLTDAVGDLIKGDGKKKTKAEPGDESDIIRENAFNAALLAREKRAADEAAKEDAKLAEFDIPEPLSIEEYRKMADAAYGDLDFTSNPKQDIADANAARDNERTAALAQLALAGGMVMSAGQSWQGLGQGFGAAAGVHDKGFDRYQNALQDSANRYAQQQTNERAFELAKRGAALDMWTQGQLDERSLRKELFTLRREDLKDARSAAREENKLRVEGIRDYYKNWIDALGNDAELADPGVVNKVLRLAEKAERLGYIIPPENAGIDVADKD